MEIREWVIGLSFLIFLMISIRHGHVSAMEMGLSSGLTSPPATAMYVLGDSSVDCGDNTRSIVSSHGTCLSFHAMALMQLFFLSFLHCHFKISIKEVLFSVLVNKMMNAATNVRKIVCAGVLPLGFAPHVLLKCDSPSKSSRKACSDKINSLVMEYNRRLEENVVVISEELPEAHVIFCDVYQAMMEFMRNPNAYGIKDAKNACCGLGRYGGESGCVSTELACQDASMHVWWDLYNPTPAVNSLLADSAWSGKPLSSICRTMNVQELISSSV
ncbi:UNVERIFIED_CONTAM: GDSL esterase/lipase [Sesamum latifolium]|uniref:GDSL esterase/lipase n=1 Tax=Sesamum latifolium TaxID=2727402 RepID=A0AAW2Y020_9LAMI